MASLQDIHRRLLTRLTSYIDPSINKSDFENLKRLLILTPKENDDANDMSSLLTILERNDTIAPGKYTKLKDALSTIDVRINREVIEPAEADVKRLASSMFTNQGQTDIVPHTSQETVPYYSFGHLSLDYQLNIVLTKIARELVADDLETMKFLLRSEIAKSVLEQISTPLKLFDYLINNGKLSRDNIIFLQTMLYHASRIDLFKLLMDYGKQNRNTLHFYEPSGNPANGYRDVKFHVACKENLSRNDVEDIRTTAAKYLGVGIHLVFIRGCEVTNSFLITLMVPKVCLEFLLNLDSSEKQSFMSLGIDFLMINDKKFLMKEGLIEKEQPAADNQIAMDLKYYMQQTAFLQKQLERYQLKEMATHVPLCSAYSSISWTLTATMFYLHLQDQRGSSESDNMTDAKSNYYQLMQKIGSLHYDTELIEGLYEARSAVERQFNLERHRLFFIQQTSHIQMLEHIIERAKFKENKLKFLLRMGLTEPILSQKDEMLFHFQQLQSVLPANIQIEIGVGQQIDKDQIEPVFRKMSAELSEKDMHKLRAKFEVNPEEESVLRSLNNQCFIEVLAFSEVRQNGMVDIDKFGEKIVSVVDRIDFVKKWKESIEGIVKGQTQRGADAGQDKDSEMINLLGAMNKRMAKFENRLRKPQNVYSMDDEEDIHEFLVDYIKRKHGVVEDIQVK